MMTAQDLDFRQVMALRRGGDHEAALAGARALMSKCADDVWHRRALCWCLVSCGWNAIKAGQREIAAEAVREARETLPPGEPLLTEAIDKLADAASSERRSILDGLKELARRITSTDQPDPCWRHEALQLLRRYAASATPTASLTHSIVLAHAVRCIGPLPEFIAFFHWWNPEALRPEDFQRQPQPGKDHPYPSLVERVLKALHTSRIAAGRKAQEELPWMAAFFESHAHRFSDAPFIAYYHGLLLVECGQHEQARTMLSAVARAHSNDHWAWSALATAWPDCPEQAAACWCRALACPVSEPSYLVRVRAHLAHAWQQLGRSAEATHEATLVVEIRRRNAWSVPPELAELSTLPADALDEDAYRALCASFAARADRLVFALDTVGVLERIDHEKGLAVFVVAPGRVALARIDRLSALAGVQVGELARLAVETSTDPARPPRVLQGEPATDEPPAAFCRRISGAVKRHPRGFGFIADAFVPPDLAAAIVPDRTVNALAVLVSKHRESPELGWKVVRIWDGD